MPLELQARLLRVLDERQVTPLGGEETHEVDFQLLSASHRHLPALVREGRFREDLYYRLAGIELELPAMRDRSDKRELIRSVLASEAGAQASISPDAEQLLMDHPWPGNVRQLRHVLRSAAALADGAAIGLEHLPSLMATPSATPGVSSAHQLPAEESAGTSVPAAAATAAAKLNPIQANERLLLMQLLEQHRWNLSNVAKALDVSRNTLYRKLRKLHIDISHP
jgi:transcriptional regulator of acetoin/glycerol metabolism